MEGQREDGRSGEDEDEAVQARVRGCRVNNMEDQR
jgi:hypothetical protein